MAAAQSTLLLLLAMLLALAAFVTAEEVELESEGSLPSSASVASSITSEEETTALPTTTEDLSQYTDYVATATFTTTLSDAALLEVVRASGVALHRMRAANEEDGYFLLGCHPVGDDGQTRDCMIGFWSLEAAEIAVEAANSGRMPGVIGANIRLLPTPEDLSEFAEYAATVTFSTTLTGEELLEQVKAAHAAAAAKHNMRQAADGGEFILLGCTSTGLNSDGVETRECMIGFKRAELAQAATEAANSGTLPGVAAAVIKIIPSTTIRTTRGIRTTETTTGTGNTATSAPTATTTRNGWPCEGCTLHPFLSAAPPRSVWLSTIVLLIGACALA